MRRRPCRHASLRPSGMDWSLRLRGVKAFGRTCLDQARESKARVACWGRRYSKEAYNELVHQRLQGNDLKVACSSADLEHRWSGSPGEHGRLRGESKSWNSEGGQGLGSASAGHVGGRLVGQSTGLRQSRGVSPRAGLVKTGAIEHRTGGEGPL